MFTLLSHSSLGRRGRIRTMHGAIETPAFFPVATGGAMRGILLEDLEALGAQSLLCNTYHLHLQPGEDIIEAAGGLHAFIGWSKPILTDSGGFQVFSLETLRTMHDHGVEFRSHIDGSPRFLGPEEVMIIQHKLGSDIWMCFDQCPPSTAPRAVQIEAVERTVRWARECKQAHEGLGKGLGRGSKNNDQPSPNPNPKPLLFAVIQGGLERDLRKQCTKELVAMDFDGYAIGGLAVGETEEEMEQILDVVCPLLPTDKPRYLMGVGRISQMHAAVRKGIDMFDCVLPMREARHGKLILSDGSKIDIRNSEYKTDHSMIDPQSPSPLSRTHAKSYLAHLFRAKERSAETIACMQNMGVTLQAMKSLRENIQNVSP